MKSFALFTTFLLLAASPIIVLARPITFSNDPSELSSRDEADPIYDVSARDLKLVDFLVREVDFDALIERRGAKNAKRPNNKPKKAPKAPAKPELKRTANVKHKAQGKSGAVRGKPNAKGRSRSPVPPPSPPGSPSPPPSPSDASTPPPSPIIPPTPPPSRAESPTWPPPATYDSGNSGFVHPDAGQGIYYPPAKTDSSPTLGRPPTPKPGLGKRIVNWGKGVWNRGKRN